jgi:hypothetical protein
MLMWTAFRSHRKPAQMTTGTTTRDRHQDLQQDLKSGSLYNAAEAFVGVMIERKMPSIVETKTCNDYMANLGLAHFTLTEAIVADLLRKQKPWYYPLQRLYRKIFNKPNVAATYKNTFYSLRTPAMLIEEGFPFERDTYRRQLMLASLLTASQSIGGEYDKHDVEKACLALHEFAGKDIGSQRKKSWFGTPQWKTLLMDYPTKAMEDLRFESSQYTIPIHYAAYLLTHRYPYSQGPTQGMFLLSLLILIQRDDLSILRKLQTMECLSKEAANPMYQIDFVGLKHRDVRNHF